jgi:hypothetical protein
MLRFLGKWINADRYLVFFLLYIQFLIFCAFMDKNIRGQAWWLTPTIPVTQEAEIRRFEASLGKK